MLTVDARRDTIRERAAFTKVRNADYAYSVQLRKIAKHIGDLTKGVNPANREQVDMLQRMLERYADIIRPWALNAARRMLDDVARRDERAWRTHARIMGRELQRQLFDAPIGNALQKLLDDQVTLITSLPIEAARRVHDLATGNLYTGARASEIAKEILATGEVTQSRANLIARTEVTRAASMLTQVRAEAIGSEGYVWRTARDIIVRPTHRKMEGKFVRWDTPPEVDPGKFYHAGMFPNCRCYCEPVIKQ
jgi:SPP1 gp7 family putative phage head morphogenesis protein